MEPLEALAKAIADISQSVRDGNEAAFVTLMEDGRRYLESRG